MKRRVYSFEQYVNESYTPDLLEEEFNRFLAENEGENGWKDLVNAFKGKEREMLNSVSQKMEEIEPELAAKVKDKLEKEGLDEAIGVFTAIGAALSAGKALELAVWIPKWISNKVDKDKSGWATKLFNWLDKKGNQYTHYIEHKMVLPMLLKTPGLGKYLEKQPKDVQEKWAKWTLTATILGLGVKSGFDAYHAYKEGHGVAASVEGALTGVKSAEVGANITDAIASTAEGVIDIANVTADVGSEVVDVIDDIADAD